MHFGFTLDSSDIDLWNIDLLDAHLDLLDTDIPSKYFACLHNVFKTSSRHVFKTCLQDIFKTCLQDVFKTCLQDIFKTCLQDIFKTCLQDVFKTWLEDVFSATIFRLPRRFEEKLLRWRGVEDVFKNNNCLLGSYFL